MSRIILNDSHNLQNVVSDQDLRDITITTLGQLAKQLLSISGPYSRNGFILFNSSTLNDGMNTDIGGNGALEIFTRDGIHCLSNISYMSPIQRYIKDQLLAFMGRRIDASCGDGTTTSMIFTASFVANLMKTHSELKDYSITEIETTFNQVINKILETVDAMRITKESLVEIGYAERDAVKLLAYLQAYTASSGKHEIASAVSEIFKQTPEVAWEYAIKQQYPYKETPEYKVEAQQDAYEGIYDVDIVTPELCNIDMGRYYQRDNVKLLIMRTGMLVGSNCMTALTNYVGKHIEAQTNPGPIVILIPSQSRGHDSNLQNMLIEGARRAGIEIFIASYQRPFGYQTEYMYSMDAISAKADTKPFTELNVTNQDFIDLTPFLIDCDIKIDHYNCYINNVTKWHDCCTEEDKTTNVHPGEKYPDQYPNYVEWKSFFTRALEQDIAMADRGSELMQKDLNRALLTMQLLRNWHISIGGKAHDQNSVVHVLDDAAKSALAAVKHGIFFNGPHKLAYAAFNVGLMIENEPEDFNQGVYNEQLAMTLINAITAAAIDMAYAVYGDRALEFTPDYSLFRELGTKQWDYCDFYGCGILNQDDQIFSFLGERKISTPKGISIYSWRSMLEENNKDGEFDYDAYAESLKNLQVDAPPAQVGNLFEVMFERLREVALRFVLTDNLIALGTVWDSKLETK